MPPVIVAVAAVAATAIASAGTLAVLGGVASTVVFAGITAGTIASVVGAVVGAVVAYAGSALIASTAKAAKPTTQQAAQDAKQLIRSSVEPQRVIYGRARVSGPIIFAESSGQDNETLHIVFPVAGHVCEDFEGIWVGETWIAKTDIVPGGNEVISGPMAGKVLVFWYDGRQTIADAVLLSNNGGWAPTDVLNGIAYFHVMLRYDENLFRGGIPNLSALVIGKSDIYDPRYGTAGHSENWALVILDYLRAPFGLACADDEIDFDSFMTAANVAGEVVQVDEEGTQFQLRYTLNGSFQLDRAPIEVMEEMIAAGGGALVYVQGQYRLQAGAYDAPTVTITGSDLAGAVQVQVQPPRRERFNSVRGTFIDNRRNYTAAEFPGISDPDAVAADGEKIFRDIDLPWCRDVVQAQRIAVLMLKRHLQSLTVTMPLRYASLNLCVMDTVAVTLPDFGWAAKPFRIIAYSFDPQTGIINTTMQEEQPSAYAWLPSEASQLPIYTDTNLASPFSIAAPAGLTIDEGLYATRDGAGVRTKAVLYWSRVPSPFVSFYEVQYRPLSASAIWRSVLATDGGAGGAGMTEILDLADDTYEFRVRARTTVSTGAWATATKFIGGLAAVPPANVSNLAGQINGGSMWLRWTRHPDLDVRAGGRIEFRHHPESTGTWANATSIGEAADGNSNFAILPLRAGQYFAKAVDAGGRYSATAATFFTDAEGQLGYSNLLTRVYDPTFTGTYTNTVVTSSTLRLESLGDIDSVADFDAIESLDSLGGIKPEGRVFFAAAMNLGSPQRVRLTPTLLAQVVNTLDQWDSRSGDLDSWTDIDGVAGGEADAWLEYRFTRDDPTGTPTWSEWTRIDGAEAYFWGAQFRCQLRSYDPAFNIYVEALSVSADQVV
jgi:hypothetical protein